MESMNDFTRHISRPVVSSQEDIDEMNAALDRRFARERKEMMGSHNVFNGSTKFVNWMLSVTTALMIASIVGGVVLYGQVQAINTKVDLLISGHIK
jgi:hypothetical protein